MFSPSRAVGFFSCFDVFFCHLLFQNITDCLTDPNILHLSVSVVLESLPPARYKETISILFAWLQQCEAKLAVPSTAVTEYPIMEQRLKDVQVHICRHTKNYQELMFQKWRNMSSFSLYLCQGQSLSVSRITRKVMKF